MRPVRVLSAPPLLLFVFVVHSLVLDAAAAPRPTQLPRTWMNAHRNGEPVHPNRTQEVTKVQVEDLDLEAASTGCVRLRELDFCGTTEDGRGRLSRDSSSARYPNALGHASEAEAKVAVKAFAVLLQGDSSCGRSLRAFLCAALTPACNAAGGDDDSPAALPPCRSVCSAAVQACEGAMRGSGIVRWPAEWSCDRFPTDGVCSDRPVRSDGGSDHGRSQLDWSQTHFIQSRGSLEPPPSSAVDEEFLALEDDAPSRRPENPRPPANGRGRPPPSEQAPGDPRFFRGWADVQGTGSPNDYCRILGTRPKDRFLSCALNGTGSVHAYISKRGFDAGHPGTWFMKDVDADGRDDYCRCVGRDESHLICMKAGEKGFYGGKRQTGSEYTFRIPASSALTISCRQRADALDNKRRHTETRRPPGDEMH